VKALSQIGLTRACPGSSFGSRNCFNGVRSTPLPRICSIGSTKSHASKRIKLPKITPTVSLGVTSAVVYTYGCNDGRISPTRCAIIDAGLGDRCSRCRGCSKPPAGAGSARIALAATSRPVSTIDPGGSPRSRTRPPSRPTPCGDASLARFVPDTRPCPLRPCLV